jgi:hypothetical protein
MSKEKTSDKKLPVSKFTKAKISKSVKKITASSEIETQIITTEEPSMTKTPVLNSGKISFYEAMKASGRF